MQGFGEGQTGDGNGHGNEDQAEDDDGMDGGGPVAGARPRQRATKLQAAEKKVATAKNRLQAAEKRLNEAKSTQGYACTEERRKAEVSACEIQLKLAQDGVAAAEDNFMHVMEDEARKVAKKQARDDQQEQRRRDKQQFGEDTLAVVVQCKVMFDKEFDDSKLRNDQVWPKVHQAYLNAQARHDVPADATLTLDDVKKRYQKELEYYRDYIKRVQRKKQSGASTDEVDMIQTRCVSHLACQLLCS